MIPEDDPPSGPPTLSGSWSQGWPVLKHDGVPYESERIIVFSGYSSQEARAGAAAEAEEALDDLVSILEVSWKDFTFLSWYDQDKIYLFTDVDQMNSSGLAYRDGVIVRAKDSPRFDQFGYTDARWRQTLQHELTHVAEFLLIGNPQFQQANDVWLREGGASYGARIHTVQSLAELDAWKIKMAVTPGGGNPVAIHSWSDFPQSVLDSNTTIEYYKFFELTTRYLMDPNGNGTSINNLKALYWEMGQGVSFRTAFDHNFGLNLSEFESNWWDLMRAYLS